MSKQHHSIFNNLTHDEIQLKIANIRHATNDLPLLEEGGLLRVDEQRLVKFMHLISSKAKFLKQITQDFYEMTNANAPLFQDVHSPLYVSKVTQNIKLSHCVETLEQISSSVAQFVALVNQINNFKVKAQASFKYLWDFGRAEDLTKLEILGQNSKREYFYQQIIEFIEDKILSVRDYKKLPYAKGQSEALLFCLKRTLDAQVTPVIGYLDQLAISVLAEDYARSYNSIQFVSHMAVEASKDIPLDERIETSRHLVYKILPNAHVGIEATGAHILFQKLLLSPQTTRINPKKKFEIVVDQDIQLFAEVFFKFIELKDKESLKEDILFAACDLTHQYAFIINRINKDSIAVLAKEAAWRVNEYFPLHQNKINEEFSARELLVESVNLGQVNRTFNFWLPSLVVKPEFAKKIPESNKLDAVHALDSSDRKINQYGDIQNVDAFRKFFKRYEENKRNYRHSIAVCEGLQDQYRELLDTITHQSERLAEHLAESIENFESLQGQVKSKKKFSFEIKRSSVLPTPPVRITSIQDTDDIKKVETPEISTANIPVLKKAWFGICSFVEAIVTLRPISQIYRETIQRYFKSNSTSLEERRPLLAPENDKHSRDNHQRVNSTEKENGKNIIKGNFTKKVLSEKKKNEKYFKME